MTVKVVYQDGVFKPLHPVDLEEGTEFEIEPPVKANEVRGEGKSVWERHGLKLLGGFEGTYEEFKELGEEWKEYMPE